LVKCSTIDVLNTLTNKTGNKVKTVFVAENSRRIVFKQYVNAKDRFTYVKQICDILKSDSFSYNFIDLKTMRTAKDYCFKVSGIDKLIYVYVKPFGKRSEVNSHEFLTAAIVLLGGVNKIPTEKNIQRLYSKIATKIIKKDKIKDYTLDKVNSIDYDYNSVCQAISAAKVILNTIKNVPDIAYLTGTNKWHKDIKHLKFSNPRFKNYNSSDIVFKKDNNLYGISLKRKELITDKDPPALNKSLLNLFKSTKIKSLLETTISDYFIDVLNQFMEQNIIQTHGNRNNWQKIISELDIKLVNDKIKNDKCMLWENLRNILFRYNRSTCKNIIQHMIKPALSNLKDTYNFDFFVVTGIGRFRKNKGFIVEPGEIVSHEQILKVYNRYIKNKKITIQRNRKYESEQQSTLFLTIYADKRAIINMAIRYKGRFHTSPEILAFFTREFKSLINN
jgi:hypothetical protein